MTPLKFRMSGAAVRRTLRLCLALLATGSSLRIAVEAGYRLGSSSDEGMFLAVGGIVAVLSSHLLMPIFGPASAWQRLGALVISISCASFVVYLHASYFLAVQAEAGARRMASVTYSKVDGGMRAPIPRRSASAIREELAEVKAEQGRLQSTYCLDDCSRLDARKARLRDRIAVLEAETDEVRRWQLDQDQLETRKAEVKDDPVTFRLSGLFGVSASATVLALGLLFAVILEGTGCLCWFLVLQRPDLPVPGAVTMEAMLPMQAVTEPITAGTATSRAVMSEVPPSTASNTAPNGAATTPCEAIDPRQKKMLLLIERVRPEIEAGRVGRTVTAIREYLACARSTAAEVRRVLNAG